MPLVNCYECGKERSSDAKFCPHCGVRVLEEPSIALKIIDWIVIALFVLAFIGHLTKETPLTDYLSLLFWFNIVQFIFGMINPLLAFPRKFKPTRWKVFILCSISGTALLALIAADMYR